MASIDPASFLQNIAEGSFRKVVDRNNRLILIEANTTKVKNKVLREFIEQAKEDGYGFEELVEILLIMDESVEKNTVQKTLREYLNN